MSSEDKSEKYLKELSELEQRLDKIQSFLRESKTGNINDSYFTKDNILAAIDLLEKINPEEKNMIYALKMLIPLSEKSNEEIIKQETKMSQKTVPLKSEQSDAYNHCTPKLKSKIPNHRII